MKIALYNSTYNPSISPLVHFGCELVRETIEQQLDRVGHEYYFIPWQHCVKGTYTIDKDVDLVLVNGEGSWHSNKRPDMLSIAAKYPCVMFNTVYQNNGYNKENLSKFKAIFTRESMSADEVNKSGASATVIPDVILTNESILKRSKSSTKQIGSIEHHKSGLGTLQNYKPFLDNLENYSHIASGSYHGALICAMLDIPFSMWPSNTHKMQALAKDIEAPETHFRSRESAIKGIPDTMKDSIKQYVYNSQIKINNFFENLESYV